MTKKLEAAQQVQEEQYAFPYHYLPSWSAKGLTLARYWPWGYRYLGGLRVVLDLLKPCDFSSLIDIGCGDGRFLREAAQAYPDVELLGVDYSERAIHLAQAFNPDLHYAALNILEAPPAKRFAMATLIEVLEHIPPAEVARFVAAVANLLEAGGQLVLTVPHRNKPVIRKHFQHFSAADLRAILEPHFTDIAFTPFDALPRYAPLLALLDRLIGGKGKFFVLTHRRLLGGVFRYYLKHHLYVKDEQHCERIAVVCRKRSTP